MELPQFTLVKSIISKKYKPILDIYNTATTIRKKEFQKFIKVSRIFRQLSSNLSIWKN